MVSRNAIRIAVIASGVLVLSGVAGNPGTGPAQLVAPIGFGMDQICSLPGPEYYAFDLVTTGRIPGSGLATGRAEVSVSASSPFSVALAPDGSYEYEVYVSIERMKQPREGVLVAWIATRELDRVERIGALDQHMQATGTASWNKFLIVITLESADDPTAERWTGPVVLRGMSRSGMMHTMAGHGAFQVENCAAYGYDE